MENKIIKPEVGKYYRYYHVSMVDPLTIQWIYILKVDTDEDGWIIVDGIVGYDEHPFVDGDEDAFCDCDPYPYLVTEFSISPYYTQDNKLDELTEEEFLSATDVTEFNELIKEYKIKIKFSEIITELNNYVDNFPNFVIRNKYPELDIDTNVIDREVLDKIVSSYFPNGNYVITNKDNVATVKVFDEGRFLKFSNLVLQRLYKFIKPGDGFDFGDLVTANQVIGSSLSDSELLGFN